MKVSSCYNNWISRSGRYALIHKLHGLWISAHKARERATQLLRVLKSGWGESSLIAAVAFMCRVTSNFLLTLKDIVFLNLVTTLTLVITGRMHQIARPGRLLHTRLLPLLHQLLPGTVRPEVRSVCRVRGGGGCECARPHLPSELFYLRSV